MSVSPAEGIAYYETDGTPAPDVLGFQYLRVMAAAAMAFAQVQVQPSPRQRVLCIGLGTGALPGFLAHRFRELTIDVCEIDPLVVSVARKVLRCQFQEAPDPEAARAAEAPADGAIAPSYRVLVCDAAMHVQRLAVLQRASDAELAIRKERAMVGAGLGGVTVAEVDAQFSSIDDGGCATIFLDAFDAAGQTPAHLLEHDFLRDCHDSLTPGGVLVVNCFNGADGSDARVGLAALAQCMSESGFQQLFSLAVLSQEESVVLVARRGGRGRRPGGVDLRDAASSAWRAAGLSARAAARLVRQYHWVQINGKDSAGACRNAAVQSERTAGIRERRPPRRNLAPQRPELDIDSLAVGSSACPEWMRTEEE